MKSEILIIIRKVVQRNNPIIIRYLLIVFNIVFKMHLKLSTPKTPTLRSTRGIHRLKTYASAEILGKGAKDFKTDVPSGLNKISSRITQPKSQGASQAMLYGTGLTEDDMNKPQVNPFI